MKKYRIHELAKFNYSEIGEYIDEYHTDRPLRNDILVNLLNKQDEAINELKYLNRSHARIIMQLMDKINQLEKKNEQLKQLLDLFASDICKATELLDDNNIEYELCNDVENFIVKWGVRIE